MAARRRRPGSMVPRHSRPSSSGLGARDISDAIAADGRVRISKCSSHIFRPESAKFGKRRERLNANLRCMSNC